MDIGELRRRLKAFDYSVDEKGGHYRIYKDGPGGFRSVVFVDPGDGTAPTSGYFPLSQEQAERFLTAIEATQKTAKSWQTP
jgi:hypothetical protein